MFETMTATRESKNLTKSNKRKFFLSTTTKDKEHNCASYWDEGSKSNYSIYNYLTKQWRSIPTGSYPTFKATCQLENFELLIKTGIFCGKEATPHITCLEDELENVRKLLCL